MNQDQKNKVIALHTVNLDVFYRVFINNLYGDMSVELDKKQAETLEKIYAIYKKISDGK